MVPSGSWSWAKGPDEVQSQSRCGQHFVKARHLSTVNCTFRFGRSGEKPLFYHEELYQNDSLAQGQNGW